MYREGCRFEAVGLEVRTPDGHVPDEEGTQTIFENPRDQTEFACIAVGELPRQSCAGRCALGVRLEA